MQNINYQAVAKLALRQTQGCLTTSRITDKSCDNKSSQ